MVQKRRTLFFTNYENVIKYRYYRIMLKRKKEKKKIETINDFIMTLTGLKVTDNIPT